MNIDNKMPLLKNFMTETKLSQSGLKSTINDSAVSSTEQNTVSLELKEKNLNMAKEKFKKKKKENEDDKDKKRQKPSPEEVKKTNDELKTLNVSKINKFVI
jgi:hypothetical protein